jgi:hypothetical protein
LRRIPLSRRSHVTGFQSLATGLTEHESALGRDFVTLTSFTDAAAVVTAQPVTIRFKDEGRQRRYTPDFRVDWSDGRIDIVEITHGPKTGMTHCRTDRHETRRAVVSTAPPTLLFDVLVSQRSLTFIPLDRYARMISCEGMPNTKLKTSA